MTSTRNGSSHSPIFFAFCFFLRYLFFMTEQLNWIHQQWTAAGSGKIFSKTNPWDQTQIQVADSEVMDVVMALQGCKKALPEILKLPSSQILEKIKTAYLECTDLFLSWAKLESDDQGLPQSFLVSEVYETWAERIEELSLSDSKMIGDEKSTHFPTGVVAISVSWSLAFHQVLERMIPALLAQNTVLIHLSEESPQTAILISDFVTRMNLPVGSVQILVGKRKNLVPILAGHPGIAALSYTGSDQHKNSVVESALPTGKKLHLLTGVKNSLILLPGRSENLEHLFQSCLNGLGQMPWNTTRIFILESEREEFLKKLEDFLKTQKFHPLIRQGRWQAVDQIRQKLPSEEGKPWPSDFSKEKPLFSLDLPNCSTWQQDDLRLPYFIITSVKYAHEIAKWTNTGAYGHSAVIYGDPEKAGNLAAKLEVGLVQINHWKIPVLTDFNPLKSSVYGATDLKAFGSFFSNQIQIEF